MSGLNPIRVAIGLSGRIYAGRVNKAKTMWSSAKWDVTSDVLAAVIAKVGEGNTLSINENGKPTFEITVKRIQQETSDADTHQNSASEDPAQVGGPEDEERGAARAPLGGGV